METYQYNDFKEAGIDQVFVQDNQSSSKRGVLRGLHFQKNFPQDKLVRVIKGEVFDVAVDLRKGSLHSESGMEKFCLTRIKNSFSFRKILPMDFWYFPGRRNFVISVRISIMGTMREAFTSGIARSV
jgi:hypothetical protein